jgi:hypothetical protein
MMKGVAWMGEGLNPLRQVALPFAEGEASHAERWNDLGIALLRIPPRQCTAQLAGLVRWIFNVTKGGLEGALTKSFSELAQRPWGLCCDERTVRRTVANARRYGLIAVEEQRRWDGSQQCNSYTIDWTGIIALKNGVRTDGHCAPPLDTQTTGVDTVSVILRNSVFFSLMIPSPDRGPLRIR